MANILEYSALALGPTISAGMGWLLIWVAAYRDPDGNQFVGWLMRALGAVLLIGGVLAGIIINSHIMSVFLLIAVMVIGSSALVKFYSSERQSLMWVLTIAAERGIPLESAALAFAEERNDLVGRRAKMLADYLEAGVPLALALSRSRCKVTAAAQLAADLGQRTGTLGIGMRQATAAIDEGEAILHAMIERLFYFIFLLVFGTLAVTFIMLKITPVMSKMMEEFEFKPPETTTSLIEVADTLANGWVGGPLVICSVALFAITVVCYAGYSPREFPIVNRLWWSADRSLVMHWLAIAVRQNLPLGYMVRMLAAHFPQARVRRSLERASMRIDRGQDWQASLRATRDPSKAGKQSIQVRREGW